MVFRNPIFQNPVSRNPIFLNPVFSLQLPGFLKINSRNYNFLLYFPMSDFLESSFEESGSQVSVTWFLLLKEFKILIFPGFLKSYFSNPALRNQVSSCNLDLKKTCIGVQHQRLTDDRPSVIS